MPATKVWLALLFRNELVEDLQAELNNARLEGAGDLATAGGVVELRGCAESSAEAAPGQIEIGVVEDVVGLGAELNLQALDGSVELLVEGEVGLVEGRACGRGCGWRCRRG